MTRTAEQVAVDEALREAVERWLGAYEAAGAGVLSDFLIVGAVQGFDDDGDPVCSTFVSHAEAAIPTYRMLGLIKSAELYLTGGYVESDE